MRQLTRAEFDALSYRLNQLQTQQDEFEAEVPGIGDMSGSINSAIQTLSGSVDGHFNQLSGTVNARFLNLTGSLISSVAVVGAAVYESLRVGTSASDAAVYESLRVGTSASDAGIQVSLKAGATASLSAQYTMMIAGTSASDAAIQTSLKTGLTASFASWGSDLSVVGSITGSGQARINNELILQPPNDNLHGFHFRQTAGYTASLIYEGTGGSFHNWGLTFWVPTAATTQVSVMALRAGNGSTSPRVQMSGVLEVAGSITGSGDVSFGRNVNFAGMLRGGSLSSGHLVSGSFNAMGTVGTTFTSVDSVSTPIAVLDSTAMAAGVGGGILFTGKYTSAGDQAGGGGIKLMKQNASSGDYSFDLVFGGRLSGQAILETFRISGGEGAVLTGTLRGSKDASFLGSITGSGDSIFSRNLTIGSATSNVHSATGSFAFIHNSTAGAFSIRNTNAAGPTEFLGLDAAAGTFKVALGYANPSYGDASRAGKVYLWRPTGDTFVLGRSGANVDITVDGNGQTSITNNLSVGGNLTSSHDLLITKGGADSYSQIRLNNDVQSWQLITNGGSSDTFYIRDYTSGYTLFQLYPHTVTPGGFVDFPTGPVRVQGSITGSGDVTFGRDATIGRLLSITTPNATIPAFRMGRQGGSYLWSWGYDYLTNDLIAYWFNGSGWTGPQFSINTTGSIYVAADARVIGSITGSGNATFARDVSALSFTQGNLSVGGNAISNYSGPLYLQYYNPGGGVSFGDGVTMTSVYVYGATLLTGTNSSVGPGLQIKSGSSGAGSHFPGSLLELDGAENVYAHFRGKTANGKGLLFSNGSGLDGYIIYDQSGDRAITLASQGTIRQKIIGNLTIFNNGVAGIVENTGSYRSTQDIYIAGNPLSGTINAKFASITAAAGLVNVQRFTNLGAQTYTPTAGTNKIIVKMIGGGGGGGGINGVSGSYAMGTGGASGVYWEKFFSSVSATGTIFIGAGGASGSSAVNNRCNGGTGADTSFSINTVTYLSKGGLGGSGSFGYNVPGGLNSVSNVRARAGYVQAGSSNGDLVFGEGGSALTNHVSYLESGRGGGTPLGAGGPVRTEEYSPFGTGRAGYPGQGYGSGGGGAVGYNDFYLYGTPTASGGGGAPGIVIIEEYA